MNIFKALSIAALCCIGVGTHAQETYSTQAISKDLNYFTDWTGGTLEKGFNSKQLKNFHSPLMKQLASQLAQGTYQSQYLLQSYKPIASNQLLQKQLKLFDGFSRYENITGVYLEQGENVVLVGDLHGRTVGLLIPDWMRQPTPGYKPTKDPEGWGLKRQDIALHEGVNVIYVKKAGNVYLDYYADDPDTAPQVTIHFVTGKANGYFDSSIHNEEDWKRLLDNAVSPILDVKTKYMQLAYPVAYLKKFAYGQGKVLAENYDKIMQAQYDFSGATKYNRIPDKRILARVNYNYFMFRDGDGVAFEGTDNTMKAAISSAVITDWGIHHEIGHVMQMRPQLTWGGMTEVSNNLFSMYGTMSLGAPSRLSNRHIYEAAFKKVLDAPEKSFIMCVNDPFHKLIPFWQLQIYACQKGNKTFYADLMEHMRTHPHKGTGNESINNMYEFMKLCCDYLKTDLTEFFDAWGFFEVGTFNVGDYGNYVFKITPEMVEDTKKYIASKDYPKPEKNITRLTD
mgnify:CR=1 FL=1